MPIIVSSSVQFVVFRLPHGIKHVCTSCCRILQEYIQPLQDVNLDYFVVFCVKTDCVQIYIFPWPLPKWPPSSFHQMSHIQSLERGKRRGKIWGGEKREGKNLWRGKSPNGGKKSEQRGKNRRCVYPKTLLLQPSTLDYMSDKCLIVPINIIKSTIDYC